MVLKHHRYEVDPRDSVLKASESNNPTETRYSGRCQQNISIIARYGHIWYKQSTHTTTQHGTRSIELVAMSEYYTNTIYKLTDHGNHR